MFQTEKLCCTLGLSILLLSGSYPAKAMILGDFDQDGEVDAADLAHLKLCALGAAVLQMDPACADARLDGDADVDLDDFGALQRCYSGEGRPADPNCGCPSGQTDCNGTCTSTRSDNANCGACGNACAAGLTCQNGSCAACPSGQQAVCGGVCTSLEWDNLNCGACGNICPTGTACMTGVCTPIGPPPDEDCNNGPYGCP